MAQATSTSDSTQVSSELLLAAREAFVVIGQIVEASGGKLSDCPVLIHLHEAIEKAKKE